MKARKLVNGGHYCENCGDQEGHLEEATVYNSDGEWMTVEDLSERVMLTSPVCGCSKFEGDDSTDLWEYDDPFICGECSEIHNGVAAAMNCCKHTE